MSSTVHRFTPPTCTLEIVDRKSSLAPWASSEREKQHWFKLRFDDPRQVSSDRVTIEGNQQDLVKLQTAISRYVRVQLQNFHSFDLKTPEQNEQGLNIPYLQPDGLVHHELFFGCLAHDSDRPKIKIGTVQLFDLVAALEAYQATITAAPVSTKHRPQRKIVLIGTGIAAVAIAAIAIGNLRSPQMQQNVAVNPSAPSPENIATDEITPPVKPNTRSKNVKPKLTEPLASAKRLPPPPAVETPKPKPNIPDPADYSRSEVARQSGLNNAAQKPSRDRASESVVIAPADTDAASTKKESRPLEDDEEIEANQRLTLQKDTSSSDELETAKSSPKPNELSQIKAYFSEKWQPPKDLKESLEYRLLLNPNGSIARVIPLGKAARFYLDRTSIPSKGEAFISPISEPSPSTIRLLLNPDGRVQAFIESR